jgi:hypothetical protein
MSERGRGKAVPPPGWGSALVTEIRVFAAVAWFVLLIVVVAISGLSSLFLTLALGVAVAGIDRPRSAGEVVFGVVALSLSCATFGLSLDPLRRMNRRMDEDLTSFMADPRPGEPVAPIWDRDLDHAHTSWNPRQNA